MSNYLNIDIPVFTSYLDSAFLYNKPPDIANDRIPVEVFGFVSIPQRCAMFNVMTEYGTQHARVPIHYLRTKEYNKSNTIDYALDWLQLWDSLSYYVSINQYQYLKNRAAKIILKNQTFAFVKYMFTIDWCLGHGYYSGYGEMAGGHKCGHVFEGDDQYFIQPNNRIFWMDGGSWINKTLPNKPSWKVFTQEFSCEHHAKRWITKNEEDEWFYEFKEVNNE